MVTDDASLPWPPLRAPLPPPCSLPQAYSVHNDRVGYCRAMVSAVWDVGLGAALTSATGWSADAALWVACRCCWRLVL